MMSSPAACERKSQQQSLELALTRHVEKRTWGHIHQLDVQVTPQCVILSGCTRSYYDKQLALTAAREILGTENGLPLDLRIEVGAAAPRMPEGRDMC